MTEIGCPCLWCHVKGLMGFPDGSVVKNPAAMQETWVQPLGWEDPLEKGMTTHCEYSCLENPMDSGAGWATVHGVPKSWTWLSDFHFFQSPSFIDGNTDLREGKSPIKIAQQSARTGTRTKLWAHYLLFQRDRLRGRKAVPGGQDSWG